MFVVPEFCKHFYPSHRGKPEERGSLNASTGAVGKGFRAGEAGPVLGEQSLCEEMSAPVEWLWAAVWKAYE